MKRFFYLLPMLTSLFLAGCSQEEPVPGSEDVGNGFNTSYMAVNLVSSDITGSRAAAGYENGTEDENKVTKVRFYFFTANGAAANVKLLNNNYVNFYDWEPGTNDQSSDGEVPDDDDIESKLKATIVINTQNGDKLPQGIAAVLNPTGLDDKPKSLSQLKEIVGDYAQDNLTRRGAFVMFNSVYGDNGAEVCAVPITSDNLKKTAEEAKNEPVTIYVERSVAKVKVSLGTEIGFNNDLLALKKGDGNLTVGGEQVYLKLNGWNLTAETDNGRLVKKIDLTWTQAWWNGTHRSFWAMNAKEAKNRHGNYNSINNPISQQSLYTNENALDYSFNSETSALNRTKVILKGTLCKYDGTPFTIVRHLGAHFADTYSETPSENLPGLKANILSQMATKGKAYYYEETEGETTTRKQIGTADLKIVVAEQQTIENSQNNCYVYAQLTDDAATKKWYDSLDAEATPLDNAAATINNSLKDREIVDWALVWKNGMTYYYYEIIHDGSGETATKGVVRNHIYDTKVTKIAGLGTPVYDPDKTIYPEKPDPNDHYIAAQINILSWRIVSDSYELEW